MAGAQIGGMRLSKLSLALLLSVLSLGAIACGSETPAPAAAQEQPSRRYDAQGEVRAIAADHQSITIHHQAVPDYMPEMTMPFSVEDASLLEGLAVGDQVRFTFSPEPGGRHVLRAITKI